VTLRDGAIRHEWEVNIGRRTALARCAAMIGVVVDVEERPTRVGGHEAWVRAWFGDFITPWIEEWRLTCALRMRRAVLSQRRRKRVANDRTGIAAHIGENGSGGGCKKQGDRETKLAH
jgi:hypothetical protein